MKLTTGIVLLALTAGTAWAQNPAIIQNTKDTLQGVQQQKTAASNAALQGTTPAKPSGAVAAKPGAAKVAPVQAAPAKAQVVPVKVSTAPVKSTTPAQSAAPAKAQASTKTAAAPAKAPASTKTAAVPAKTQVAAKAQSAPATKTAKPEVKIAAKPEVKVAAKPTAKVAAKAAPKATGEAGGEADGSKPDKQDEKKYSMTGKRDPFLSPVVNRQSGSGCSSGKKCLDIEQIALHGVVKSDNGMIAVVTNSLNKAYFLRENDPVFNGYVVKITVDSIVFKETFQDRLGKAFTKDVVKRILTPAV